MVLARLIERNLKLYFRDKTGVFFSLLAVILVIVMYAVFLGQNQIDGIRGDFGNVPGIDGLVIAWLMSGLLGVTTLTIPVATLGIFVEDKETRLIGDFYTAPINRQLLILSYLLSTVIITTLMALVNLVVGQVYLAILGAPVLGIGQWLLLIGMIALSSFVFSSILFYVALWMKTSRSFGSLGSLVGTLVGFFGGIYLPIGVLPTFLQNITNLIPVSHSVTLFRVLYMQPYMDVTFDGAPTELIDSYLRSFGYKIWVGDWTLTNWQVLVYFIISGVLFYVLSVMFVKKSKLV